MEWEGEIMVTQSRLEGNKAPLTVTVRYSSSERLEFELTLTWRKGLVPRHFFNVLLFNSLKFEIAVWFWCMAVEFICKGCNNDHEKEGEELRKKTSNMMKNLKTQEEYLQGSLRKLWEENMFGSTEKFASLGRENKFMDMTTDSRF